jgi:ubiquinone/menaquinone biosynthesis C-methylase UbiE
MERPERARSFGAIARDYERGRATYPDEAVGWLVSGARRIVDLGAGTGKLTTALGEPNDQEVLALEPQHSMMLQLRRGAPGVMLACSVAEAIPVRSRWAQAVTVAQAFHWFDRRRAVPEIRRILAPGGVLGLIWNVRDESVDWVAQITRLAGPENSAATRAGLDRLPGFAPFEFRSWSTSQVLDRASLSAHIRSRSNVATLSENARAEVLDEVFRLCDTHPALRGREHFELPYRTEAFRARLAQSG